jgi:hypothetical protein
MGWRWHRTSRPVYIFQWEGNQKHELGTGFSVHKRIISAVNRVEFVSDRMSYILLRVAGVISSFSMFMPQERTKLMM